MATAESITQGSAFWTGSLLIAGLPPGPGRVREAHRGTELVRRGALHAADRLIDSEARGFQIPEVKTRESPPELRIPPIRTRSAATTILRRQSEGGVADVALPVAGHARVATAALGALADRHRPGRGRGGRGGPRRGGRGGPRRGSRSGRRGGCGGGRGR